MRFDLTPMIDIVFQLIIFFLAASHLARNESTVAIELPEAKVIDDEKEAVPERLVISVTPEGKYSVGDRLHSLSEVEHLLLQRSGRGNSAELEVRIRADKHSTFQAVEPLMSGCARAGIKNVKFAVLTP